MISFGFGITMTSKLCFKKQEKKKSWFKVKLCPNKKTKPILPNYLNALK